MKNPYKPYEHTDGFWYVRRGKKFYRGLGKHSSEEEAWITCHKTFGHECQDEIDKINKFLEKHDPSYDPNDPNGWLA